MTSSFALFRSWTGTPNRNHSSSLRGASGEDGGEFGLDLPSSESLECYGELPELKLIAGKKAIYGSVDQTSRRAIDLAQKTMKMHTRVQQTLAAVAIFFIISMASKHLFSTKTEEKIGAPAAAAGESSSAPQCDAYTYPQCEAALHWYMSQSARNRCEAFERVKGEGDFFKFPYSATLQDTCTDASCCGCAGQCSKCPPVFPTGVYSHKECSSWRLDGTWKVAFGDGSESKYTFDAHGLCEVELAASALPVIWKEVEQSYIPQGHDVDGQLLTLLAAKKECEGMRDCKGITYDSSTRTGDAYFVYLKTTSTLQAAPGTTWKTMVQEQRPDLQGAAAVAGPLVQVSEGAAVGPPATYSLDLHKSAPQLFPEGSMEHYAVLGEELTVQRQIAGAKTLEGIGVRGK